MSRRIDLTGQLFGCLTAVEYAANRKWLCVCDCGKTTTVASDKLRSGHTKSCGHLALSVLKDRSTKHGMATRNATRTEYTIWVNMKRRCNLKTDPAWKNYGGRGIKVCERWLAFENFYADMGPRPGGMSLDRIDNDGDYEPANCRWADRASQRRNSRRVRTVVVNGVAKCLADWAALIGVHQSTTYYWIGRYGEVEGITLLAAKHGVQL